MNKNTFLKIFKQFLDPILYMNVKFFLIFRLVYCFIHFV